MAVYTQSSPSSWATESLNIQRTRARPVLFRLPIYRPESTLVGNRHECPFDNVLFNVLQSNGPRKNVP